MLLLQLTTQVHPVNDRVSVDGVRISARLPEEVKWIALHKPKGAVTTTNDEKASSHVSPVYVLLELFHLILYLCIVWI